MRHERPGHALEQLERKMVRRSVAGRGVVELARIGFRVGDHSLHVAERHRGIGDEEVGRDAGERDRREILRHVEGGLVEALHHGERQGGAEQRVAVGRRLRRGLRADKGVAAGPVLDDHRLAERLRQLRGQRARKRVVERAGREGDDVAEGFRGPAL